MAVKIRYHEYAVHECGARFPASVYDVPGVEWITHGSRLV